MRDETTHSNTQVTREDEYYELSGLPDLRLLPAFVSQELSGLLERLCEAGVKASVSSWLRVAKVKV